MSAQGFQLRLRGGGASKRRRKEKRIIALDHGAVVNTLVEPHHDEAPKEALQTSSTFENEAKVGNSSLTRPLTQEIKREKHKRFIAFIGKPSHSLSLAYVL